MKIDIVDILTSETAGIITKEKFCKCVKEYNLKHLKNNSTKQYSDINVLPLIPTSLCDIPSGETCPKIGIKKFKLPLDRDEIGEYFSTHCFWDQNREGKVYYFGIRAEESINVANKILKNIKEL